MYVCVRERMCMCVRERERECVCVCDSDKGRIVFKLSGCVGVQECWIEEVARLCQS